MDTPKTSIRLNADIDEDLHHQFKMACLIRKETMTDVITGFIKRYVDITKPKGKK